MNKQIAGNRLAEYNSMIKEHENLYRQIAKRFGLSECAFWILYSLRETDVAVTQSELCFALSQPKQTINTALKKLEDAQIIELLSEKDKRRKQIQLTEKGEQFARQTVDLVIQLENKAFDAFTEAEQKILMTLLHKYTDNLKNNLSERNFS